MCAPPTACGCVQVALAEGMSTMIGLGRHLSFALEILCSVAAHSYKTKENSTLLLRTLLQEINEDRRFRCTRQTTCLILFFRMDLVSDEPKKRSFVF